jgi:hypothetical protein
MGHFKHIFCFVVALAGCRTESSGAPDDLTQLANAHVALLRLKASIKTSDSLRVQKNYSMAAAESLRTYGFTKEQFEKEFISLSESSVRLRKFHELTAERSKR